MGDITHIYDSLGNLKAEYSYDAWGNHKIITNEDNIANINPFRYRGYYYDIETGLYYLQSRYYDPETGRFINADAIRILDESKDMINGLNLFVYCGNNPIMNIDPSGKFFISFLIGLAIAAAIGAAVGMVAYTASEVINYAITGEWNWSWGQFVGSAIGGAIGGALSFLFPAVSGILIAGITGVTSTAIGMGLQNAWEGTNYSFGEILMTSLVVGGVSMATAGIMDSIRIPGINAGRGSFQQVSRQINTKFWNNSISSIAGKTFGKMAGLVLYQSTLDTIMSGLFSGFGWNDDLSKFWSLFGI